MVNIPTVIQFLQNSVRFLYVSCKLRLSELQSRLEHGIFTFVIYLKESSEKKNCQKLKISAEIIGTVGYSVLQRFIARLKLESATACWACTSLTRRTCRLSAINIPSVVSTRLRKTMKHRMDSGQIHPEPLQVQHD